MKVGEHLRPPTLRLRFYDTLVAQPSNRRMRDVEASRNFDQRLTGRDCGMFGLVQRKW